MIWGPPTTPKVLGGRRSQRCQQCRHGAIRQRGGQRDLHAGAGEVPTGWGPSSLAKLV
jgi:hypothetical protein